MHVAVGMYECVDVCVHVCMWVYVYDLSMYSHDIVCAHVFVATYVYDQVCVCM